MHFMVATQESNSSELEDKRAALARRIRALRERLGLSQEAFADASGGRLSRTEINKAERGLTKGSTSKWPDGIAAAAGLPTQAVRDYLSGSISLDDLFDRRPSQIDHAIELARAEGVDEAFLAAYRAEYATGSHPRGGLALVVDLFECWRRDVMTRSAAAPGEPSNVAPHQPVVRSDKSASIRKKLFPIVSPGRPRSATKIPAELHSGPGDHESFVRSAQRAGEDGAIHGLLPPKPDSKSPPPKQRRSGRRRA